MLVFHQGFNRIQHPRKLVKVVTDRIRAWNEVYKTGKNGGDSGINGQVFNYYV